MDAVPPDLPRGPVPHLIVGIVGLPSLFFIQDPLLTPWLELLIYRESINPSAISVGSFFSTLDIPDFRA